MFRWLLKRLPLVDRYPVRLRWGLFHLAGLKPVAGSSPDDPENPDPKKDEPPDPGKTFTQAELDGIVQDRLRRQKQQFADYDELKEKARQFDEIEDAQKNDLERVTGERDTVKDERDKTAAENLRLRVALEKKVPAELIDRLRGTTKEELAADADQLLELVKSPEPGPGLDGGPRDPAPPADDGKVSPGLGRIAHAYAQADDSK